MRKLVICLYTIQYYFYYIHVHVGMRLYWFFFFTMSRLQQKRIHHPIKKQMLEDDRREVIVDFFSGFDNHWLWWTNRTKCCQIWKLLQIHEQRRFIEAWRNNDTCQFQGLPRSVHGMSGGGGSNVFVWFSPF